MKLDRNELRKDMTYLTGMPVSASRMLFLSKRVLALLDAETESIPLAVLRKHYPVEDAERGMVCNAGSEGDGTWEWVEVHLQEIARRYREEQG